MSLSFQILLENSHFCLCGLPSIYFLLAPTPWREIWPHSLYYSEKQEHPITIVATVHGVLSIPSILSILGYFKGEQDLASKRFVFQWEQMTEPQG